MPKTKRDDINLGKKAPWEIERGHPNAKLSQSKQEEAQQHHHCSTVQIHPPLFLIVATLPIRRPRRRCSFSDLLLRPPLFFLRQKQQSGFNYGASS